jgi:SAM-dependent methyltransferase
VGVSQPGGGSRREVSEQDLYAELGERYVLARRTDPRIAEIVWGQLGGAQTVLNVGAGTGSYEPLDRSVVALEPSPTMRSRRPPAAARCHAGVAEALPFGDSSFDAVMSVCSDWFWPDRRRGFAEMRRVARRRVLVLTLDRSVAENFWLSREYLPDAHDLWGPFASTLADMGRCEILGVPVPADCRDGFFHAYWRRPHAYLDEGVRESMAVFKRLDPIQTQIGLERLADDLATQRWHARHGELLAREALDLGYRLLVAEREGPID